MRKNGKNKKLALLVGMAMAFSAAYSVAPSDALAADYTITATTANGSTTWEVKDENNTTVEGVKGIAGITKLMTESGNNFKMSSEALAALKPTTDSEGGSSSVTIAKDNTITITTENAGSVTYTSNGEATLSSVTSGSGSTGTLGGKFSTITVNGATGDSATASTIKLAENSSVDNLVINGGTASINSGAANVTVAKGATLNVAGEEKFTNINLADGAKITTASGKNLSAATIDAKGDIDLSEVTFSTDSTAAITSTGKVTAKAVGAGMSITGNGVSAESVAAGATINAGAGDVSITGTAAFPTGDSTDGKTTTITGNNIEIKGAVTDGEGKINAAGKLTLTGGFSDSDIKNLTVSADTIDLDKNAYNASKVTSDNIKANNLVTSGKVTVGENDTLPFTGSVTAGEFSNASSSLKLDSLNVTKFTNTATTEGAVNLKNLTITGSGNEYSNSTAGAVNVDSLKLGAGVTFTDGSAKINANTLIIDSKEKGTDLANLSINEGKGGVKLVVAGDDKFDITSKDNEDLVKALNKAIYGTDNDISTDKLADNITVIGTTSSVEDATTAVNAAKGKMQTYSTYTADEIQTKIANADPFTTKLPSAADLQKMTSADEQKNLEALNKAQKSLYDAQLANNSITLEAYAEKVAALPKTTAEQAEKIRAAVQNAGKTAAAPAVTSMRTANVVADVATTNVVNRTAELRSFVPSAESEEKPDNLWFQYKHSKIDVDNGDTYSKSTVKTNSYQLGYDAKVSETDIVGGYVGTTTGSSEFNGPARSGSVDIKNALDLGLYGTHMMTKGQYIDYMLHRNKFDNRTMGQTYGTTDLGAMLRYGVKIAQPNGLTLDPYIQLAYDKISVDSYQAGENTISSDDSNNFSTKIGLNLITTGGLYGGVAYSRGLSGSYSAYVNGIAMPTQDNDTNVIYLNLGYRAGIARDIFLDLSLEKTFCDYDGWNAAGKINFYF